MGRYGIVNSVSVQGSRFFSLVRVWVIGIGLLTSAGVVAQNADTNPAVDRSPADIVMSLMLKKAESLAASDFESHTEEIPEVLQDMNYEQYRSIYYRRDAGLWRDDGQFEVQFFHPGFLYTEPVAIRLVDKEGAHKRFPFDPSLFRYGDQSKELAEMSAVEGTGYSGFRVHYPINMADKKSEFVVFQGASYFRIVGPNQFYGISARGLAVDTAEPGGEEFPVFREFWLLKPDPDETVMTVFALLDSASVTGAYRFDLEPGSPTAVKVEAHVFARKDIIKLGVAPLTSMYLHGENSVVRPDDFRPEVHDSDGLMMQTNTGEWVWRPLDNPRQLQVSSLQDTNPKGFGLMQRDRDFSHYLDAEAHYHQRPSFWVEPLGDWGDGRVELVEIPTSTETNDNMVAYWVANKAVKAGDRLTYRYRVSTWGETVTAHDLARVKRTRIGWAAMPGQDNPPPKAHRKFIVDFHAGPLDSLSEELQLKADLSASSGEVKDIVVSKLPQSDSWRVAFTLIPGADPVDMRLALNWQDKRLSEVWSYVWYPNTVE